MLCRASHPVGLPYGLRRTFRSPQQQRRQHAPEEHRARPDQLAGLDAAGERVGTADRSDAVSTRSSAVGSEPAPAAAAGSSAAKREPRTAPRVATPRPLPNSVSVPLTPAPMPALAGGMADMIAVAMAGIATAIPDPISTRPASTPPHPSRPSSPTAARPPAIIVMPARMVLGVPNRVSSRAPTPLRLSTTIIRASGAVRRPAANGS